MNISPHGRYCLCSTCRFALERSAFEPAEFVRRAERHELNEDQRKIVEKLKLENWQEWAKS
ncbi:MAG TPA: hypothetical protein VHV10_16635 [Ktedonobacteraceae bacterium]|jgi:hypothetical protein|nr:hypothetical protein [Ktedonobacteraceae bacterium]